SLEAHRSRPAEIAEYQATAAAQHEAVLRRRFVCHPRRYASDRAVGLRNNDQLSTTVGILLGNEHGLAAPGMKRVVNPPLDRVSAGSMSLLRAVPGSRGCRSSARAGAWRSS